MGVERRRLEVADLIYSCNYRLKTVVHGAAGDRPGLRLAQATAQPSRLSAVAQLHRKDVREAATTCPAPESTLKVVSESRVTYVAATCVPILVFLGLCFST